MGFFFLSCFRVWERSTVLGSRRNANGASSSCRVLGFGSVVQSKNKEEEQRLARVFFVSCFTFWERISVLGSRRNANGAESKKRNRERR
jgi:hypothetical protein